MKKQMTAAEMGRKGGTARAAAMSKEDQRAHALKAVEARWNRTEPYVAKVLEEFDANGIADHFDAVLWTVPAELRDEVRRRALREAIKRQTQAVASSSGTPTTSSEPPVKLPAPPEGSYIGMPRKRGMFIE